MLTTCTPIPKAKTTLTGFEKARHQPAIANFIQLLIISSDRSHSSALRPSPQKSPAGKIE